MRAFGSQSKLNRSEVDAAAEILENSCLSLDTEATFAMKIKVAAIQLPGNPHSLVDRFAAIESELARLSLQNVKLAVLPEMGLPGYDVGPDYPHGEPIPGPSSSWLAAQSKKHQMVLVAGMAEAIEDDIYNVSIVTDPQGFRGKYRKIAISTVENAAWERGTEPGVIETGLGRIAVGICADMVYPTIWTTYRQQRPDLVVISAAWPDFGSSSIPLGGKAFRDYHRRCVKHLPEQISQYVGAPVIFSNCSGRSQITLPFIGHKIECQFAGGSRIVDGTTLVEALTQETESVVDVIDTGASSFEDQAIESEWLSEASWLIRKQFYLGESLSRLFFRGVYRCRRARRHRAARHICRNK